MVSTIRDRITVRMTDEMIARIDAWIADQDGYVSRQEAVRRLVLLSFDELDRHEHARPAPRGENAGTEQPRRS